MSEFFKPVWPALFMAVVVGLALYIGKRNLSWHENDRFDFWMPLVLGIILTAIATGLAAAAGCGLADCIGHHSSQVWRKEGQSKLVSLRNSDGVTGALSGGIFLVSGYIGQSQVYYYYIATGDSVYQSRKWYSDSDTFIVEEDRSDAEVVWSRGAFRRGDWMLWLASTDGRVKMEFHIPAGSLKQGFDLK